VYAYKYVSDSSRKFEPKRLTEYPAPPESVMGKPSVPVWLAMPRSGAKIASPFVQMKKMAKTTREIATILVILFLNLLFLL
jgi:hypothetical protein